jgi:hypothetical protein
MSALRMTIGFVLFVAFVVALFVVAFVALLIGWLVASVASLRSSLARRFAFLRHRRGGRPRTGKLPA